MLARILVGKLTTGFVSSYDDATVKLPPLPMTKSGGSMTQLGMGETERVTAVNS